MKSRTLRKIIAATTLVLGVAISVTSSLSWFDETVKIETENVTGVSEGAYFHSGNGTKDYPYTITRKRHLYNLAWLQYLGYFLSKDSEGNIKSEQNTVYFRLLNDINMDGMYIPPIGTSEYPFIGNFDGQGYKVTNFKTTNDYSDFTGEGQKHPYTVTTDNFKDNQVKIVGFFGVVGSIGDSSNYTYDSKTNQVKNVGLDNFEVKSKATDTLVGLAAGYVNGELASVAVNNGKLNLTSETATTALDSTNLTSNVSDYSIVGYATDPYKTKVTKVSQSAYKVNRAQTQEFVVQEDGDENGYGGSIDMKSLHTRLNNIKDNYATNARYDYWRTYDYHSGVKDTNYTATAYASNYYSAIYNTNDTAGHYNFALRDDTYDSRYTYLAGGYYETGNYYELADHKQFVIFNGTYYIQCNGTTIDKTTNESNATTFEMDSTGKIFYKVNNSTYYLRNYYGDLAATNNEGYATSWTINDDKTYRIIGSTYNSQNYYIKYDTTSESWILDTYEVTYSISYQNTNNHLSTSGNNLSNSTTNSPIWYLSSLTGTTTIYTIINGQRYYLYRNNGNLRLNTNSQNWNIESNGDYLRFYNYRDYYGNYYLSFYYNNWTLRSNTNNANLLVTKYIQDVSSYIQKTSFTTISKAGPDEVLDKTVAKMTFEAENTTYFPLATKNNTNDFTPLEKNSAYIISGSSISGTVSSYKDVGNTRVSYYPISGNLKNFDRSTGEFTQLYTVDYSGSTLTRQTIPENNTYVRYKDAKASLEKVLSNDGTNAYGMHFMDASISKENIITAPYVKLNKDDLYNYELPVNSIDFQLKEFGYINFIAGTYYVSTQGTGYNNSSFFALYKIERLDSEPKKINRILEIDKVYKHTSGNENYSYVYQLKDGNSTFYTKPYKIINQAGDKAWLDDSDTSPYSTNTYVETLPSGYTLAFDVARIRKNNIATSTFNYNAYYFEIPMNDGEFCLGSVEGSDGSYLMYLDIAANAQNVARTVFAEYFLRYEDEYNFPIGVAVVSDVAIISTHTNTTDQRTYASDSFTVIIEPGYKDKLEVSRDTSGAILTRSTTSSLAEPGYKDADLSLKENNEEITEFKYNKRTTYETVRNIIIDRDTRLESNTITVIEENYIDGVLDGSRSVKQYNETIDEANLVSPDKAKYYLVNADKGTGKICTESEIITVQPDKSNSNVLITYTYLMQDGSTSTNTFVLNFTKETDTNYYTANGYTISVTLTPAEDSEDTLVMTVTVYNANGEKISINTITINGTGPVA
ncbi:MAG: hypothetical protein IJ656_03025 [Bacilli bacterium]|nr:hypothetical protein [Bacilli bacterium]MBR1581984.1 hypothetical protein [Bacilli bacterium]